MPNETVRILSKENMLDIADAMKEKYTNQDAIAKVKVGENTFEAAEQQDTFEVEAGQNVTLTLGGDKLNISAVDTTYEPVIAGGSPGLMTGADKTKLDGIEQGAQVNIIEGITVGGTAVTPTNKVVALGSAAGAYTANTVGENDELPTGTAIVTYVANAIATAGHLSKQVVNTVPTAAEADEDVLYYVMNTETGYYDIYQKIGNAVVRLDDVSIDLTNYVQFDDIQGLSSEDVQDIIDVL